MAQGHEGAFGASIKDEKVCLFTDYANHALADFDFSQKYFVDLIYDAEVLTGNDVLEIANYEGLWG